MAKFVFKLDGVLKHRTNIEHQRKRELAFVQAQMTALDGELRALDSSVRASVEDLRTNRLLGKIDLSFLAAHRRYSIAMQRKAMGIAEKMAAIQQHVDRARRNLSEASKQRKILEKLRERLLARWTEAIERRDVAEMDEIAMQLGHEQLAPEQLTHADMGAE
jgi:flagellar FliJ protein